jgi:tRNA threonylcarbamoyl adenosine modification protein (Sua5/YciO/YrdC/YwlC family)
MRRFSIHPVNPQRRLVQQAAELLRSGGLAAMPTDACYVLACHLGDKAAVDRLRSIRAIDDKHLLTLMCRDLSELAQYARVDNSQYRFLKEWTPGAYTFILPATKEVPRRLMHPSRKTVGLRVPGSPTVQALLEELGEPVLCSTLILPGDTDPLSDPEEIESRLSKLLDLMIEGEPGRLEPTTVIDMTGEEPMIARAGLGSIEAMTLGR